MIHLGCMSPECWCSQCSWSVAELQVMEQTQVLRYSCCCGSDYTGEYHGFGRLGFKAWPCGVI